MCSSDLEKKTESIHWWKSSQERVSNGKEFGFFMPGEKADKSCADFYFASFSVGLGATAFGMVSLAFR